MIFLVANAAGRWTPSCNRRGMHVRELRCRCGKRSQQRQPGNFKLLHARVLPGGLCFITGGYTIVKADNLDMFGVTDLTRMDIEVDGAGYGGTMPPRCNCQISTRKTASTSAAQT